MLSWYLIEKPLYFYWWEPIQGMGDVFIYQVRTSPYFSSPEFTATKAVMQLLHWPLVALGFVGLFLPWLRPRLMGQADWQVTALRLLSVLMVFVLAVHMIGAPYPRYSVPFRPLTWLFAVLALQTGWLAWRSHRRAREGTPGSAIGVVEDMRQDRWLRLQPPSDPFLRVLPTTNR